VGASTSSCSRRSQSISTSGRTRYVRGSWPPRRWRALTSLEGTFDEKAEQREPVAKAEALAVLDDAMLFLRGGIDALQDK
jgi:hypothetical protein